MERVLVTGIEPFDGDKVNPSWQVAQALAGERIAGAEVVVRQLACVLGLSNQQLIAAIEELRPKAVICLGLAGGRGEISVERVAINLIDARIPDNAGKQPIDIPVVEGGPVGYFSTLPVKAIVHHLHQAGIPAAVSHTAGTYNCNQLFYGLSHHIASQNLAIKGGFIHIPYSHELAVNHPGKPSLALAAMIEAVRSIVHTTLTVDEDLSLSGGALH
ncbi:MULTISPECIES: pyroglutamyl-peptidase I [Serratia]|mgnify:FL=1|uniref:Pyrrolidone-carboxylate peptidase n=1 Tax=Serratia liquefaciens TaxID=614 RepID=A0ABX7DBG0_SERLI|nr:pyroglutamyl-peptidase I [Serratia liquefaciens]AUW40120.1 pyroglutamyl-peptidase I [Serratia liquefaciens]MBF8105705.1 pyroglutamyl-peptidase I [Serratia liquefaciens]MBH2811123.1 pyroglutamyl-peptidase I [Serratia liquefaciens]NWA18670.1 pyroglutamyl-peptidase I [Serratia liquefaciens]OKP17914.1 pyroglutamyl-peptidase I [Serratia liquefaciens]